MDSVNEIFDDFANKFAGHDSFALRYGWLEKAYYQVKNGNNNPFTSDDAIVHFGVGKNMVKAIRHWSTRSNFLIEYTQGSYKTSEYADITMGNFDPYIEKSDTLWKIHYELATNRLNSTIFWLFNSLNVSSFNKNYVESKLSDLAFAQTNKRPVEKTLRTDINVALSMYCQSRTKRTVNEDEISSPLQELNLINLNNDGSYSLNTGPKKSLSNSLFLNAVLNYWKIKDPSPNFSSTSLRADRLLYEALSPGRIFGLSETELMDRVHQLPETTQGELEISDGSGITQIFKRSQKFDYNKFSNQWCNNE